MTDDSYGDGEGQQNLEIYKHIMDREDWNLAKRLIN
jgi:hypothetical protein